MKLPTNLGAPQAPDGEAPLTLPGEPSAPVRGTGPWDAPKLPTDIAIAEPDLAALPAVEPRSAPAQQTFPPVEVDFSPLGPQDTDPVPVVKDPTNPQEVARAQNQLIANYIRYHNQYLGVKAGDARYKDKLTRGVEYFGYPQEWLEANSERMDAIFGAANMADFNDPAVRRRLAKSISELTQDAQDYKPPSSKMGAPDVTLLDSMTRVVEVGAQALAGLGDYVLGSAPSMDKGAVAKAVREGKTVEEAVAEDSKRQAEESAKVLGDVAKLDVFDQGAPKFGPVRQAKGVGDLYGQSLARQEQARRKGTAAVNLTIKEILGDSPERMAADKYVIYETDLPTPVLGEGGGLGLGTVVSDVSQLQGSIEGTLESPEARAAGLTGLGVAATGVALRFGAKRVPVIGGALSKWGGKAVMPALRLAALSTNFVGSASQELGSALLEYRQIPELAGKPKTQLGLAVAYALEAATVETAADAVQAIQALAPGKSLRGLDDVGIMDLAKTLKRRAVLANFRSNPGGAVGLIVKRVEDGFVKGFMAEGIGEEGGQQVLQNLNGIVGRILEGGKVPNLLGDLSKGTVVAARSGGVAGGIATAAGSVVADVGFAALAGRVERLTRISQTLAVIRDEAKKGPDALRRFNKGAVADLRAAAALDADTVYVKNRDLAAALETAAKAGEGGPSSHALAIKTGLTLTVFDNATADIAVPVSFEQVLTKFAPNGLLDTDIPTRFALEPGGPTTADMGSTLKTAMEDLSAEAQRRAEQEDSVKRLMEHLPTLTTAEMQREAHIDPVTGALSAIAAQDDFARLHAAGYQLVKDTWEGGKLMNDSATHDVGDGMYRMMASALSGVSDHVYKIGGDLYTLIKPVEGQSVQDAVNARNAGINRSLPHGFRLLSTAGPIHVDEAGAPAFRPTLTALDAVHESKARSLRAAGTWAERGSLPIMFKPERAPFFRVVDPGVSFAKAGRDIASKSPAKLDTAIPQSLIDNWKGDPDSLQRLAERLYLKDGLLSARGYFLLEKIAPLKHTLSIDMRGFGDIAKMGRVIGDMALTRVAAIMNLAGAAQFRGANIHGDEFVFSHNDPAKLAQFKEWLEFYAANAVLDLHDPSTGARVHSLGVYFHGEIAEGNYEVADAKANASKKLLDAEAERIQDKNEATLLKSTKPKGKFTKEITDEDYLPIPVGSGLHARSRLFVGHSAPRDVWRSPDLRFAREPAAKFRGSVSQNFEGLAESFRARQVEDAARAIAHRAEALSSSIAREAYGEAGTQDSAALQGLVNELWSLASDLTQEAEHRISTSAIRIPDDVGEVTLGIKWMESLKSRAEHITGTAIKIEERAAARILKAIKDVKALVAPRIMESYKGDARKANDPLLQMHRFLFMGKRLNEYGHEVHSPVKLERTSFAALVEGGLMPQSTLDDLDRRGRFGPGGFTFEAVSALLEAGSIGYPSADQWADITNPPTDKVAGQKAVLARMPELSQLKDLETYLADEDNTIGSVMPVRWFLDEIRALNSRIQNGPGGSPVIAYKRAARNLVASMRRGDLHSKAVERAERLAGTRAIKEAAKGNLQAAVLARQEQLTYLYALKAAQRGDKIHVDLRKLVKSVKSNDAIKALAYGSPAVADITGRILNKFDLGRGRFPMEGLAPLREAVSELVAEDSTFEAAFDFEALKRLLLDERKMDLADLTTEQAENLRNALLALKAHAKKNAEIRKSLEAAERAGFVDIVSEEAASTNAAELRASDDSGPAQLLAKKAAADKAAQGAPTILALLSTTLHDEIIGRVDKAVESKRALLGKVLGGLIELLDKHAGVVEAFEDPLDMNALREHLPAKADDIRDQSQHTRGWAVMVALNASNPGNLYWMLTAEGWKYQSVADFLASTLTKPEWEFVKDLWAFLDREVYPHVQAHHRERMGFDPPKVEGMSMYVPVLGEVVTGGYFPIRFDSNAWAAFRVQVADELADARGEHFQGHVGVNKGSTIGRREFATAQEVLDFDPMRAETPGAIPLDLRWGVIPSHLEEMVHYATMEDATLFVHRLLQDKGFQTVLDSFGGKTAAGSRPALDQLRDWVQFLARGRASAVPAAVRPLIQMRSRLIGANVANVLGANPSAWGPDVLNIFAPSALRLFTGKMSRDITYGGLDAAKALGLTAAAKIANYTLSLAGAAFSSTSYSAAIAEAQESYPTMYEWARSVSLSFRNYEDGHRAELQQRAVDNAGRGRTTPTMLQWAQDLQWWFQRYMSSTVGAVAARAKYLDMKRAGITDEDAMHKEVDRFMHAFMVAHDPIFQSSAMRHREYLINELLFKGFHIKVMGEFRKRALHPMAVQVMKAHGVKETAGRLAVYGPRLVGASLAVGGLLYVAGSLVTRDGPEEGEDWGAWAARKMAIGWLSSKPVIGIASEPAINVAAGKGLQVSARTSPTASGVQDLMRNLQVVMKEESSGSQKFWATVAATAMVGGLPGKQLQRTGSWTTDAATGDIEIESLPHAVEGFWFGPPKTTRLGLADILTGKRSPFDEVLAQYLY